MRIIQLEPARWFEYKNLRLESVLNDTTAFSELESDVLRHPDEYWKSKLERAFEAREEWRFFAEECGEIIGMIGAESEEFPMPLSHIADISNVYIRKDFRGKGVASMLLSEMLEALLKVPRLRKVKLDVTTTQDAAIRLYKKFGFNEVGIMKGEMILDGEEFDLLLMEKKLK